MFYNIYLRGGIACSKIIEQRKLIMMWDLFIWFILTLNSAVDLVTNRKCSTQYSKILEQ